MLLIRKKSRSEEDNWSEDETEIPTGGSDSLPVGPISWVIVNASLRCLDVTQRSPQRNFLWGKRCVTSIKRLRRRLSECQHVLNVAPGEGNKPLSVLEINTLMN